MQLAFFGGIYNNYIALKAAIADARQRGAERMFCLGDLGAFGPYPDRTCELIREHEIEVVQGNYDHSIGHALNDCQCGYTDPRDNYFAQISYDYTLANTSDEHRAWLRTLPTEIRLEVDGLHFLLCHGSPRRTNEFLWESTTSTPFLKRLCGEFACDVILGTHTGLHWQRTWSENRIATISKRHDEFLTGPLPKGCGTTNTINRGFINVGVLGRPANDGTPNVWYTMVRTGDEVGAGRSPLPWEVEFVPLAYNHDQLAREMTAEHLPDEFIATILTGWWTTCLEVLPSKERRRGRW